MNRSTCAFWLLVGVFAVATAFFGVSAETQRRYAQRSGALIETGDLVKFDQVVDGDTLVVTKDGAATTVRLVGLKAFDTRSEKDIDGVFGRNAEDRLRSLAANQPLRVLLHAPSKDKRGRTLATLYAGDEDIAQQLIREGLGLVYTVYPFPAMASYQTEQAAARVARRGLWANDVAVASADALLKRMRETTP